MIACKLIWNVVFSSSTWYITCSLHSLMSYQVKHLKRNSISMCVHVLFFVSLLYLSIYHVKKSSGMRIITITFCERLERDIFSFLKVRKTGMGMLWTVYWWVIGNYYLSLTMQVHWHWLKPVTVYFVLPTELKT